MKRMLPLLLGLLLMACEPAAPLRLGYIGAVSGRFSDLDSMGRDGAMLAVEMRNQAGGIRGRQVELIVRDAGASPEETANAVTELAALKVVAIVGPMTSRVAVPAVPAANREKLIMVAGTATTTSLSGLDDYFFRIIADAAVAAGHAAEAHCRKFGFRRVVVVIDVANEDYVENWQRAYRSALEKCGGAVLDIQRFDSRRPRNYQALANAALAMKPDLVSIASEATDAALLAQKLRQASSSLALAGSNWVGTERLLEVGGKAVEGMILEQSFRRDDPGEAFAAFRKAFVQRFGREPNVGGVAGFDAANVVMLALEKGAAPGQLRATLLAQGAFPALQDDIRFNATGDVERRMYLGQVRGGYIVSLP